MSASNKKKLRKLEAEAKMTERQQAASKEAKKQKRFTLTFWVVIVLCLCITLGALLTNPAKNIIYRNVTAVEVGDYTINAVELNYFYADAISQFYNDYSSYISYFLDTSAPLNEQVYDKTTGDTWADYFVSMAHSSIKSTYALYDLAMSENFTLSDEQKTSLDSTVMYLSLYASIYGYSSVDAYLVAMYGNGATEESYRAYYEKCLIAEAYYSHYSESLEYDAETLTAFQHGRAFEFNSYTFASYYLAANRFYAEDAGTKGEDGKITYSAEEKAAAAEAAKLVADALASGNYATLEDFDIAIGQLDVNKTTEEDKEASEKQTKTGDEATEDETTEDETIEDETTEGETNEGESNEGESNEGESNEGEEEETVKEYCTKYGDLLYTSSSLNALFKDWLSGKVESENEDEEPTYVVRQEGEMTVIENSSGEGDDKVINGYYILRFGSVSENEYVMKNVRHILVKFVKLDKDGKPVTSTSSSSSSSTTYTDEEKEYAFLQASELLKQWKDGEATEDTFAELANKESEDTGSNTNGGLYENIYRGQMEEAFEEWCYDETRQAGDTGIVETEYGYHIMYFVGDTEQTFRDYLVTETKRSEDVSAWYEALVEAMTLNAITDKYVNKETTIG